MQLTRIRQGTSAQVVCVCRLIQIALGFLLRHMLPSTTLETASSYNVSVLFGDIFEVVDGRATSWDYDSGRNISRPSAKGKIGGFPCQDASSLNERHRTSTNRNAIADNSLRTGKVFNAIVAIDEDDASSEWAIYENVVEAQPRNDDRSIVGPSNLAVAVHMWVSNLFWLYWDT